MVRAAGPEPFWGFGRSRGWRAMAGKSQGGTGPGDIPARQRAAIPGTSSPATALPAVFLLWGRSKAP